MAPAELKVHEQHYPTHDLELVVLVFASKDGFIYLYGVHVEVFTDARDFSMCLVRNNLILDK